MWSRTGAWDNASTIAVWSSNGVISLNGLTTGWNTASSWVALNSNALQNGTGNWNSAYVWSTNDAFQDTNVAQAVMALYPTGNWNTVVIVSNNATFASNSVVATSNQLSNLPTNNWNTTTNWVYSNTNNIIVSTNKIWAIAAHTNDYTISTNWVTANSNLLSASSIVSTSPSAGIVVGAAATGFLSFTNNINLATSSNFIISVDGMASHTAGANNARGCNAYIWVSWDTGFSVSNLVGQVWMTAANVSPSTNILHVYVYAKNITNNQIKVEYRITSVGAGSAGLYTNFDILIEPK